MQEFAAGTESETTHGQRMMRHRFVVQYHAQVRLSVKKIDEQLEKTVDHIGLVRVTNEIHNQSPEIGCFSALYFSVNTRKIGTKYYNS